MTACGIVAMGYMADHVVIPYSLNKEPCKLLGLNKEGVFVFNLLGLKLETASRSQTNRTITTDFFYI